MPATWLINEGTLGNWVAKQRERDGDGGELGEDERAGLSRLRKENTELRMQLDVLIGRVGRRAPVTTWMSGDVVTRRGFP